MQKRKLLSTSFLIALFFLGALCSAQTITMVSGNGQLVCPTCPGAPGKYTPLTVMVTDVSGHASVGTTVSWVATQPGYPLETGSSVTDVNGQASFTFNPIGYFFGEDFLPATVVASALGASVTFVETTTIPAGGGIPVTINLVPYGPPQALTGAVGTTSATLIEVTAYGNLGPLQNIAVQLTSGGTGKPSVACANQPGQQPGTVLTDATGIAKCTPVFGGTIGKGTYDISVGGGILVFGIGQLTVTAGVPSIVKYISGDKQTVNAGSLAPLALTAEVTDLGGNASSGAKVNWAVTQGTATLSSTVGTSASTGTVSTRVTPTAGPVQVTVSLVSNPAAAYVFTVNVNTVVTSLQAISNTTEQAKAGNPFPDPLIVQANDNAVPVSGATVNYSVAPAGVITLSAASAVTGVNGQAQVTATAGANPGVATVTASTVSAGKTYSQTFTLTVQSLGATITSISDAAGFRAAVSPCSLAYITGAGFADDIQGVIGAFIEPQTTVDGISVQFTANGNNILAPVLDVANESGNQSIGIQIPCELQASSMPVTVPMTVIVDGVASQPYNVTISTFSPGIFEAYDAFDGVKRAVMLRPDGSFVTTKNPAVPGETIRMFVTGLGQTNPGLFTNELDPTTPGTDGILVPQFPAVVADLVIGVNDGGANLVSATYAYGMVGVYQIDFQVPQNTPAGNGIHLAIVVVSGSTAVYGNGSLIPVR